MAEPLDEKDSAILAELRRDARASTAHIARRTGLPRVTVHERIERLRARGVVRAFTAVVDPAALGRGTTAFILAAYEPGSGVAQRELAKRVAKIDGVEAVYIISGEFDLLLKVRAPSLEAIGSLVVDRLRSTKGIARTMTMSCFATIKEEP